MAMNVTHVSGYIRAIADQSHPLQTKLSLILTDFEPNSNKQGIPKAEANNILRTAIHTPLKINFDGVSYAGHDGAIPIGPITNAFASTDNGRDVIAGEAVIWNDVYEDVSDYLKTAFAEGIGTSWEIYYETANEDELGINWLNGCIFAGTCVVAVPAYGPNRTRVLAIAEKLNNHADAFNKRLETMAEETVVTEQETTIPAEAATTDTEALRTDISSLMEVLTNMYSGLYEMLDETYDIEAALVTTDMPSMAEQFTKLVASVSKRFNSLKDQANTATAELTELKTSIAQAEQAKALAEKLETRKVALSDVGLELVQHHIDMSDELFNQYVADLKSVRGSKANAEVAKPIIPEPTTNSASTVTIKELAAAILAAK